ncbi:MAG: hypothetical protein ACOYI6_08220 [Christensenellales bacterium]|jgi:hypothetical protein|nr:hypothetical protein [Clostridiales bacterium]
MISPETVKQTLLPWLGSDFLDTQDELCMRLGMALFSYRAQRDTLAHLSQQLDNLMFMAVREATQGRMALLMDTGQLIRLRMNDFALMADELLYLLFETMEKTPFHLAVIREYSMRSGSLSALRALYLLYAHLQTQEEMATLHRVITTCHEPWRFRHWIDQTN